MADPRPRLVLDCDPGHDDALALMVAHRYAEVLAVTTVAGNATLEATTRNALVVADLIGADVGVHAGASRPLLAPPRHAEAVHGRTGMDGPEPRDPRRAAASSDAVRVILNAGVAPAGPTAPSDHTDGPAPWLVVTGPMTNVALAVRSDPTVVERYAGLAFMGGAARLGNVTPVAEFNAWADPEALAVVLDAGWRRVVQCGLDLTLQLLLDEADVARLRTAGGEVASFAADLLAFALDRQERRLGRRAAPVHDACAVLAVTHPELLDVVDRRVEVELAGTFTRGMTVTDLRAEGGEPNVGVAEAIDVGGARAVLFDALGAG
ncbi:MAG: nucleoside hydrolase [Actinomycetota bacterium]|nr:nucleoside hydrolase [Actinomycetota bacterium]